MIFRPFYYFDRGCASYLFGCGTLSRCAVVDARADDVDSYIGFASNKNMRITHVIDTHVHADHRSGGPELARRTGAVYCLHESADYEGPFRAVRDEEEIELELRQLLALDLRVHQRRDEIVARVRAALERELVRVDVHLGGGDLAVVLRRLELRIVEADEPIREIEDLLAVFERDPHHLGDHLQWQLRGDVRDEVAGASRRHGVDDRAADVADVRFDLRDPVRGEALAHEAPELGVPRRVHGDDRGAVRHREP